MIQLSIITINRNNANGLRRTIESVINQTYDNFEYIIIDGASTDGSVQIIKDFLTIPSITSNEGRIKRGISWISEPDEGIYNAMNKAIRLSKGKYLNFLNSGDWLVSSIATKPVIAPLDERPNHIFQGAALVGQAVLDVGRNGTDLSAPHQPLFFQHLETAAQGAGIDTAQLILQFAEAYSFAVEQIVDDLQRPLLPDDTGGRFDRTEWCAAGRE